MTSLFSKLNTLLRSHIHDVVDRVDRAANFNTPERGSRQHEATVDALRERINQAIEYENKLQREVDDLDTEIAGLDRKADDTLDAGNEAMARHLIKQKQNLQRRREIARADLEEHRRIAESLISEVNRLDATLAGHEPAEKPSTTEADEAAARGEAVGARLSRVVHDAQTHIQTIGERLRARQFGGETYQPEDSSQAEAEVEDDLEERRNRLMKK